MTQHFLSRNEEITWDYNKVSVNGTFAALARKSIYSPNFIQFAKSLDTTQASVNVADVPLVFGDVLHIVVYVIGIAPVGSPLGEGNCITQYTFASARRISPGVLSIQNVNTVLDWTGPGADPNILTIASVVGTDILRITLGLTDQLRMGYNVKIQTENPNITENIN